MLLIAEILLTIAVWRAGWRGWALLPVGMLLVLGFVIGAAIGAAGGTQQDTVIPGLMLDFMAIVALIVMRVKSPRRLERKGHTAVPAKPVPARG